MAVDGKGQRTSNAAENGRDRGRVLIVLPTLEGGGAERFNLELADALRQKGLECTIFLLSRRGPLLHDVAERGLPLQVGSNHQGTTVWRLAIGLLVGLPRLWRAVRRTDVTIAGMDGLATIVVALIGSLARRPVIAEVHSDLEPKFARPGTIWRLVAAASHVCYPLCARVVGISEGTAASVGRIGVDVPVSVIANAVNSQRIQTLGGNAPQGGSVPTIVAVGSLRAVKSFDVLIRAHARARVAVAHRLLILGEGPGRAKLEALALELGVAGTVDMPGFASNPYRAMRRASALCLSSSSEGMPTVVLEALALGCPVIATDCAEGVRAALGGGEYGALTPVGAVGKLAAALESHLVDPTPLRLKAAAGLHAVRTDHSYEVAADRYLELIRELREGRPHRPGIAPILANAAPPT